LGIRILLIRHGETDWNRLRRFQGRSDLPLNRKGRDQARALALSLKNEPITAMHSSSLARAMETARIIKAFHPSAPLLEEKGLVEMDLGDFDGVEAHLWAEQYPDFRNAWQEDPSSLQMPGGESLRQVQVRAVDALERIICSYPPESTLLISSHNFVNLTILCYAMKIPLADLRKLKQETGALNVLCKEKGRLRAKVVNDRSYLQQYQGRQ
jgi:probable phosphoglycerate mutase